MVCGVYCVLCVVYDREKLKGLVVIDNFRYNGSDFCGMGANFEYCYPSDWRSVKKIGDSIL